MEFTLSPVPVSFDTAQCKAVVHAGISEPAVGHVDAVGSHYKSYLRRREHNLTELDDYDTHILPAQLERARLDADSTAAEKFIVDPVDPQLLYLDPIRWKEQDHYRVLGLGSLRHRATPAQIKKAHHQRALEFHPDKRAALGNANDDNFFKCVQKAYEVLSDPIKRRQYDSVDPAISDELPKAKLDDAQSFFDIYGSVFEREGRFSKRQPVPSLGDLDAPREQVEAFYRFWTGFDSWRSYEYLDKEKEATENREEKR
ncbi:Zuotin, partial [Linderina pennispora]